MTWAIPTTEGKSPEGRSFHQMQMLTETCLVICGGIRGGFNKEHQLYNDIHLLDLKTMQWSEPRTGGTFPSPRYAHALAFRVESQTEILIFGGIQAKNTLTNTDIHILREIGSEEEKNWYLVTAENKEDETRVRIDVQRAETVIAEQKRKIGDLEANIRQLRESMYDLRAIV